MLKIPNLFIFLQVLFNFTLDLKLAYKKRVYLKEGSFYHLKSNFSVDRKRQKDTKNSLI